jgi:hypothetical protein
MGNGLELDMSKIRHPKTEASSWLEWKVQCALELCGPHTQEQFAAFGMPILTNLFKEIDPDLNLAPGLCDDGSTRNQGAREKWQVFETHMHATSSKSGKRWKDWLFEKAASSSDEFSLVLEKEVFCCMRTAVRDFCSKEGRAKERLRKIILISKDAPLTVDEDGTATIEDRLTYLLSPSVKAEWNDLIKTATKMAREWFGRLPFEARIVMLAEARGYPLGDPRVESATKCKKTKLYELRRHVEEAIRKRLKSEFPKDALVREAMVAVVLKNIREICLNELRAEKACAPLFSRMES